MKSRILAIFTHVPSRVGVVIRFGHRAPSHPDYPDAWKDAWNEVGQCDPNPVPVVKVQSPQDGQKIAPNQAFDVVVDATDDTEVARVDVQLNGQVVATSGTPSQGDTYTITVPAQS